MLDLVQLVQSSDGCWAKLRLEALSELSFCHVCRHHFSSRNLRLFGTCAFYGLHPSAGLQLSVLYLRIARYPQHPRLADW